MMAAYTRQRLLGALPERWCLMVLATLMSSCIVVSQVQAAVFTLDLGSESMKVAVVNPRPGQSPISIAINEMSKRKSPVLVAYSNGDRLLSEEAAGIVARYPDRVYSLLRNLIGLSHKEVKQVLAKNYLPYDVVEDSERKGSVKIRSHDGLFEFYLEELLGMVLAYARDLAESHARTSIVDCVVGVPAYFSQAQRQAIFDAGDLGGVNVMALYQEHVGPALQYGIDKDFNETKNVVIYDMGASSTVAAVLQFSSYVAKERGKNTTFNQFQVKAVRWDHDLGGLSMEARLVEHFADEFNSKMSNAVDIRNFPKGMAKLKKQVKRTKEILSANSEAPISVESIYEETDFRSSITREKFESLCADLWPRAVLPLQQVLADAELAVDDLHGVEVVGGATRVPKVQAVLSDFLGSKPLDRHLDADESLALGAALFAANLSDGFKLNRKLGMVDGLPFGVKYRVNLAEIKGAGVKGGESSSAAADVDFAEGEVLDEQTLFPRLKKLPIKIIRSLRDASSEFLLSFLYDDSDGHPPPPGFSSSTPIQQLLVTGVANATEKYSKYNLTSPLKINLHFALSRSGTVGLEKVEMVVEFSEWVEVQIPVETNKTAAGAAAAAAGNETSTGSAAEGNGTSAEETAAAEGEDAAASDAESEKVEGDAGKVEGEEGRGKNSTEAAEEEGPKFITKKKLKKRTIRMPLKVADVTSGYQRGLSSEEFRAAKSRLAILKTRDEEKKATAEAKNNLEAYIYSMKDKMESEEGINQVTTEEQRDEFRSQLVDAEDWLYMDGENANTTELKAKLREVKATGDAIFFRLEELSARPEAVEAARKFSQASLEVLASFESEKPWVNQTEVEPVVQEIEALLAWLKDKEEKQKGTPKHETPVFTSSLVQSKVTRIQEKVDRLKRIPKPRPKKTVKIEAPQKGNATDSANESEYNATGAANEKSSKTEPEVKSDEASRDEL